VPVASLSYDVPDGCPNRQTFEDLVSARLGYVAFVDDAPLSLAVSITAPDGTYRGSLQPSQQEVRGSSCDRVSEALGMLVAIAIDPLGEGAAAAAEAPRRPLSDDLERLDDEPPPPRIEQPSPHEEPEPESESDATGPHAAVRARLHGSVGIAPAVSLGGGAGASLRWGAFSIGTELFVEATPVGATVQGVEISGMVWRAGLSSCGSAGVLSACGLVQLGQLHARSDTATAPNSGSAVVAYAGARLGVGFDALDLRWGLELDVLAPFVRPSVALGDYIAWTAPVVSASLGLSVELEP
jgi:hypothetical protein